MILTTGTSESSLELSDIDDLREDSVDLLDSEEDDSEISFGVSTFGVSFGMSTFVIFELIMCNMICFVMYFILNCFAIKY